jgi:hypothetical protein
MEYWNIGIMEGWKGEEMGLFQLFILLMCKEQRNETES